jgi:hypothetical protein
MIDIRPLKRPCAKPTRLTDVVDIRSVVMISAAAMLLILSFESANRFL